MQSVDYNIFLLDIMLEEFEAYILSTVMYWPIAKKNKRSGALPRLTLGGLSLTLDELASQKSQMDREQERQYQKLLGRLDRYHSKWQVAIERKAQQELSARLNLWHAYLKDLEEKPDLVVDYPQEVRVRVMITRLFDLSGSSLDLEEKAQVVNSLDHRIGDYVKSNHFIWDEQLKHIYPKERFPYLYMSPRNLGLK